MITGHRRRPGLELARHKRSRTTAWASLALVAAVVIGEVTADVVNSRASASEVAAKTYAAAVVPLIEQSTALQLWLTDVRQHAVRLGRVGLDTALGHLLSGSRGLERQLADLGIPPPSPRAAALLAAVLRRRAVAAGMVATGVALATGPTRNLTGATGSLVSAAGELGLSDRDYLRFLSSLPPYVRRSVTLPSSRWDTASQWTPAALSAFVALLGNSPRLLVHRSLVIVAISLQPSALRIVGLPASPPAPPAHRAATTSTSMTSPTPAGPARSGSGTATSTPGTSSPSTTTTPTTLQIPPAGSISCLQPTSRVSVDVVVANTGNVGVTDVAVSATLQEVSRAPAAVSSPSAGALTSAGSARRQAESSCQPGTPASGSAVGATRGGGLPGVPAVARTVTRRIDELAAGTSDYLALAPMPVHGGGFYVLSVRLGSRRESVTLQVAPG